MASHDNNEIVIYAEAPKDGVPAKFAYAVPRAWVTGEEGGMLPTAPIQVINPAWEQHQYQQQAAQIRQQHIELQLLHHPELVQLTQAVPKAVWVAAMEENAAPRPVALQQGTSAASLSNTSITPKRQRHAPPPRRPSLSPSTVVPVHFDSIPPLAMRHLRDEIRSVNLRSRPDRLEIKESVNPTVRIHFDQEKGVVAANSRLIRHYADLSIFLQWEWDYIMGYED